MLQSNTMKKLTLLLTLLILGLAAWPVHALGAAQETEPVIYFFWGDGCPHCATAKPALRGLAERLNVELREYEVWYSPENQKLFFDMAAVLGFQPRAVPTIIIGERYWEGYAKSIESQIEAVIADCRQNGCPDPGAGLIPAPASTESQPASAEPTDTPLPLDAPTFDILPPSPEECAIMALLWQLSP